MASLRDIRQRIKVVKNIRQITQAMKMVAAAKLRRVQERVERGKPYSQTMADLVGTLAPHVRDFNHPLLDERPVGAIGVVVIAADKGLAGSYNSNLLRLAHSFIDKQARAMNEAGDDVRAGREQTIQLITVGRKATDYFTKRGYNVVGKFGSIGVETPYDQVRAASNAITSLFLTGAVDEVYIVYTEFINTISQRPQSVKFLPIEPPQSVDGGQESVVSSDNRTPDTESRKEFIFEPNAEKLLGVLLPRFVETRVYQLLMEAVASEFGARMTAMTNATKNAGEQIDALTLVANRTRQAAITTELSEIVSGADALKG